MFLIMMKRKAIPLTLAIWLVGTIVYGYWWVTSILFQPDLYGYERWAIFPIIGFLVHRFPLLLIGLLFVIYAEALLFEMLSKKT